jgi:hypothetical protein
MRQIGSNEPTRYEVIVTNKVVTFLVAYTPRQTLRGIIDALLVNIGDTHGPTKKRIDILSTKVGVDPESWVKPPRGGGQKVVSGPWTVQFSGYTQRDRRTTGEIESIYTP